MTRRGAGRARILVGALLVLLPTAGRSEPATDFRAALRRSSSPKARQVLETLDRVRGGAMLNGWYEHGNLRHTVQDLGLSPRGLDAALGEAFRHARPQRMTAALQQYVQDNRPIVKETVDRATGKLLSLIEGTKLWRSTGRPELAGRAERQARRLARLYGVDIAPALAAPVAYRKEVRHESQASDSVRDSWSTSRLGTVQFRRNVGATDQSPGPDRPKGASRRTVGSPLWWTGYQPAYLDLLYRKLPQMLEARFQEGSRDRTFRVWHAGHEDGSQTFFLAAAVDEAIARLRRTRPEMRAYLDRLKVEIVATDLAQPLMRRGRAVEFGVADGPYTTKAPLVVEEIGVGEVGRASRAVQHLERKLVVAGGAQRDKVLERLASSGKVGLLMRSMLDLAPGVSHRVRSYGDPLFTYRLATKNWKVEDRENGGVLNTRVANRSIRFEFADLTKSRPGGKMDLVVCTNVLPYLELYDNVFRVERERGQDYHAPLRSALGNLTASVRRGGALLVDFRSEEKINRLAQIDKASLSSVTAGKEVLVTRRTSVSPLQELQDRW
jgi:hypothetical protein